MDFASPGGLPPVLDWPSSLSWTPTYHQPPREPEPEPEPAPEPGA